MTDHVNAFVPHAPLGDYGNSDSGPLSGLSLAVKDLFDVQGLVTGAGVPAWAKDRPPAQQDAPVVARLRRAGARLIGKTITDELAWSLGGENIHYGAPINPAAPGCVTGGSSSGSAAAVAAGLADIGLGTDTGGSIRLPASYTGLWGLRTTHGRLPLDGVVPLAPSFDTAGWLTRDAATFARVGTVLLGRPNAAPRIGRVLLAEDAFDRIAHEHARPLRLAALRLAHALGVTPRSVTLEPAGPTPWRETFRICQAAEAWACHGAWIRDTAPRLGPDIAARFAAASRLSRDDIDRATAQRAAIARRMLDLLGDDGIVIVPGAPAPAHRRGLSGDALAGVRSAALDLLCPAGLAGVPQIAVPGDAWTQPAIGLGIIAGRDRDETLLALATAHFAACGAACSVPARPDLLPRAPNLDPG